MPQAPQFRKDRSEIIQWILRTMGGPQITIHLTEDQLNDSVDEALFWYAARRGIGRTTTLSVIAGQSEYTLPDDCSSVSGLLFPADALEYSLSSWPEVLPANYNFPGRAPYAPGTGGVYSSLLQIVQYADMGRRATSTDPTFEVMNGKLYLFPTPTTSFTAQLSYRGRTVSVEELPDRSYWLVRRYALAKAQERLGGIYSRYGSFPTSQGQTELDAGGLLQAAADALAVLETEIINENSPLPIIMG